MYMTRIYKNFKLLGLGACVFTALCMPTAGYADPFVDFLAEMRRDAITAGVAGADYDRLTRGLTPNLSLPNLALTGREPPSSSGQAEFSQTPAQYLADSAIAGSAGQGRSLAERHRAVIERVERDFGVPGRFALAIWARESGYGRAPLRYEALRTLATQAYTGRRKERYREEFVLAVKILAEGAVAPDAFRSSWAGALGQPQFLPSNFFAYAVDMDGDGRRDIWNSAPDVIGSIARKLQGLGWRAGKGWAYEVVVPASLECTIADPDRTMPVRNWIARGVKPARERPLPPADLDEPASLLQPAGPYGPAFLILPNYHAIKGYNFADLYVLYVGHLADRIGGAPRFATPWGAVKQASTATIAAIQQGLAEKGLYSEAVDGKAGMKTRLAIGRFQKAEGLTVDCWPSEAVLSRLRAG